MNRLLFPKEPLLLAVDKTFMCWVLRDLLRKMVVKTACVLAGKMLNGTQFYRWARLAQVHQKASQVDHRTRQTQGVPFLPTEGLPLTEETELKGS